MCRAGPEGVKPESFKRVHGSVDENADDQQITEGSQQHAQQNPWRHAKQGSHPPTSGRSHRRHPLTRDDLTTLAAPRMRDRTQARSLPPATSR